MRKLQTDLCHPTIDYKVSPVDKAAFVAGKEENRLCLLNSFSEAAARKMDFATVALTGVVAQPILEQRCAIIPARLKKRPNVTRT